MKNIADEIKYWALSLFLIGLLVFIVFFKESMFYNLRITLGLFYLFIFPGIPFSYIMFSESDFLKRFVFSFVLGLGVVASLSYHLPMIGLNANQHYLYLPGSVFVVGLLVLYIKSKKSMSTE